MRNPALQALDAIVGEWTVTLSNAWFLDSMETEMRGTATIEWLGDAFVVMRSVLNDEPLWDLAFGHSDAGETYTALYHDDRGTSRVFAMTFSEGHWTLAREDPDFHQRFIGEVEPGRITGRWEASDDDGRTWRKDFDVLFERA